MVHMIKITHKEFIQLAELIKINYGINLKKEKETLVVSRLHKVLDELKVNSFTEYYDYLMRDPTGQSLQVLVNKISTNHSFFMREFDHFAYLRDEVLPYFTKEINDRDFRLWCAASATGEEPYTLAMILKDHFPKEWDSKILATDISEEALHIAQNGVYSSGEISNLPKAWIVKYMKKIDHEHYQFSDELKREVLYRKFNLMTEKYPFKKKMHVVFCRNVMIYFDNATKEALVQKIYDSLTYGGYLFIGHSESINKDATDFKYIKPAVYRKI